MKRITSNFIVAVCMVCIDVVKCIPSDFCKGKPLYNRHEECNKYIVCYGVVIAQVLTCPYPLEWDHTREMCNWKKYVHCALAEQKQTVTPQTTKGFYHSATTSCTKDKCQLPSCWCPGPSIPGNLVSADIPQMVLLTMEDGISAFNYNLYMELLEGRRNPNGCPIKATFFLSGKENDFNLTYKLYKKGHEIGVQSLSHHSSQLYWKNANYSQIVTEVIGMTTQLKKHGILDVLGYRSPFLQSSGDPTLSVLKDHGFLYDSSMPTKEGQLWWPYTLEYKFPPRECVVEPCPKKSFPGLWEIPIVPLKDSHECTTYDSCYRYEQSADGVSRFLFDNFNRHYRRHKWPFPLFGHATWMLQHNVTYRKEGLLKFLDDLQERPDVFIVSMSQAIEWVKKPTAVNNLHTLKSWNC